VQLFTSADVFRSRRREPSPVLLFDLRSINAPGCELFLEQRIGTSLPYLTYAVVLMMMMMIMMMMMMMIIIIIIIFKFTLLLFDNE
jgi:hypothetical protein